MRATGDLHTLTGAYALHALDRHEADAFDRHLARCPACTREVTELRETAARLALATAQVPPERLRARVRSELPRVRQVPPRTRVLPLTARPRPRLAHLVTAACVALAAVGGVLAWDARHDADHQRAAATRAEDDMRSMSALMSAPDAVMRTSALRGGGTATVLASSTMGEAALTYHHLPALPDGGVYQLWFHRGQAMVPAGTVDPAQPGGSMMLAGNPQGADGVGVTAEPRGGSPQPTGQPLAMLEL